MIPFFLGSIFAGERPILPMIDLPLTKQDAIPYDFWGMLYEDWKPTPSDGVTVFLEGLRHRGAIICAGTSICGSVARPLRSEVSGQGCRIFRQASLRDKHANKPFMRHYLDYYWDIYWDLHLA